MCRARALSPLLFVLCMGAMVGTAQAIIMGGSGDGCGHYEDVVLKAQPEIRQGSGEGCDLEFGSGWVGYNPDVNANQCAFCARGMTLTYENNSGVCVKVERRWVVEKCPERLTCGDYADNAAEQARFWIARECGKLTLQNSVPSSHWNADRSAHFNWCLNWKGDPTPEKLNEERERALGECLAKTATKTVIDTAPKAPFRNLEHCITILMAGGGLDQTKAEILCRALPWRSLYHN